MSTEERISSRLLVSQLPGFTPYCPVWRWQQSLAKLRQHEAVADVLLLLQHEHVYTNGWRGNRDNLLADSHTLSRLNASYLQLERGGDITYHGPGQLVGYPIIGLRDLGLGVRKYIRRLEQVIIETLQQFDVKAKSLPGMIGVWVGDEKIAAIGVKVSHGIAYHGFALNVSPDLSYFDQIVPCGIVDGKVTSLVEKLGYPVSVDDVAVRCIEMFAEMFDQQVTWVRCAELPGASHIWENTT